MGLSKSQDSTTTPTAYEGILDVEIIDNDLFMVVNNTDGVYLEKLSLQYPEETDLKLPCKVG